MKDEKKEFVVRKVFLEGKSDKSRKGWYWYIKFPDKPARHYIAKDEIPLDAYVEYYKDKYLPKRSLKGKIGEYKRVYSYPSKTKETRKRKELPRKLKRQAKDYLKKLGKQPSIDMYLKKGKSAVSIKRVHAIKQSQIKKAYMRLFSPLVRDFQLLDILTRENNMQKLKRRFEIRAYAKDEDGKVIAEINVAAQKTLQEAVNDIKESFREGEVLRDFSPTVKQKLERKGSYRYYHKFNGKVSRVDMLIIFRKGK